MIVEAPTDQEALDLETADRLVAMGFSRNDANRAIKEVYVELDRFKNVYNTLIASKTLHDQLKVCLLVGGMFNLVSSRLNWTPFYMQVLGIEAWMERPHSEPEKGM